jgi:pyruvate/2-oxoglutarate/acetoin dehydrogenase E1 component
MTEKKTRRELTFKEAITETLMQEMERNEKVFLMGEDLQVFYGGGPFGVTPADKFVKKFGPERVRDTPISEAGFIGAAATAAATGLHPVVELMFVDFFGVCMDQIFNQAAKMRYMFGGQAKVPMTIRTVIGAGFGFAAHHSQCLYSIFAHVPGLKIVIPSTPYDAKGLLATSIRDEDPVMFFEHKGLYTSVKGQVPEEPYTLPFGKAEVKREGKDVTVVATSLMVHKALSAAKKLESEDISLEVVDPRTIVPLDKNTILESVRKTSKLVIVDEDYERCGVASEIAAIVAEEGLFYLDCPIKRVVTPNVPIPYSPALERIVIPDEERIIKAVKEIVK